MFEDRTPEVIRGEILAEMSERVQIREGSFAAEMAGPAAVELSLAYQALAALIPCFYVDEGSGGFIDIAAGRYGILRKEGTRAACSLQLTGRAGMTVPAGTVFVSEEGLEFALDEAVTLSADGTGEGTLTASEVGDAYNVQAGAVTQMVTTMTGLDTWSSGAATGGTDPETDKALVGRLYDFWRKPSTSGNVHDYERWCTEVDGVGAAKVLPLWNGPGTVKVLLVSQEHRPVDESVVTAVATHIERLRPVGAAVTVGSAGGVAINVTAALTLDGSVPLSEVKARFAAKLDAYLQSVAFVSDTVLFNRIAFLLLDVTGVTDYTTLTVNGGTDNVAIASDQVPVVGTVTLT
ncbi:baseplate J/gp47 family protein [Vermiculatibacterium agrestimuris]|uniref:baseplate J/gp47 family protein n=1 Tax=Vermiculatibacterium agrestimuris TaxID=2941519 RepID=UPI00203E85A9|nr:baseplate J/gp47 family protein [Vermiculatibacterium agrestimuris]